MYILRCIYILLYYNSLYADGHAPCDCSEVEDDDESDADVDMDQDLDEVEDSDDDMDVEEPPPKKRRGPAKLAVSSCMAGAYDPEQPPLQL